MLFRFSPSSSRRRCRWCGKQGGVEEETLQILRIHRLGKGTFNVHQESVKFCLKDSKLVVAFHFVEQNSSIVQRSHQHTARVGRRKAILQQVHGIQIEIRCHRLRRSLEAFVRPNASLVEAQGTVKGNTCLTQFQVMYSCFVAMFQVAFSGREPKAAVAHKVHVAPGHGGCAALMRCRSAHFKAFHIFIAEAKVGRLHDAGITTTTTTSSIVVPSSAV